MIPVAHFNFFILTYKISKDKILLKEKKACKKSFIQMEMTDVHCSFPYKNCITYIVP